MREKGKAPAIFSFFSGIGFLDLGFEENGFEVVYVNEYHPPFLEAYKYARQKLRIAPPELGYFEGSIAELITGGQKRELTKKVDVARNKHRIVGFIGGPPCPDFSIAGKNRGKHGDNGKLSKIYVDLIVQQKPDFFLFENVKGLWSTKVHRHFYEELKKKLVRAGYLLDDHLINSIEYGAPQDRNRIILIGFHKNFIGTKRGLALPDWARFKKYNKKDLFSLSWPTLERKLTKRSRELPRELTVEYWFKKNKVQKHPNRKDHFIPRAAASKFVAIEEGDVTKKSFKRLHRWRYSPTAAYGNNEVHIHPTLPRRISAAEALAIQSLPTGFELPHHMTLSNKFKSIGNGVPYLAAHGVARMIASVLTKKELK